MPSPFPGMNPFLEQAGVWQDFHNTFLIALREELVRQLQPRYFVRVEEHVYIHEYDSGERPPLGRPDVTIHGTQSPGPAAGESATSITAPVPVLIPPGTDELRSAYLEIRDRDDRQVVTAIEMLSPSNKLHGADREVYWSKVRKVLSSRSHFVEIDLLRGGPRLPWIDLPNCSYYALVSRVERRPRADVWPIGLRERLPIVPIPLRPGDTEASIDLQSVLHRVYDAAGYADSIYDGEPEPPLDPPDREWAASLTTS